MVLRVYVKEVYVCEVVFEVGDASDLGKIFLGYKLGLYKQTPTYL